MEYSILSVNPALCGSAGDATGILKQWLSITFAYESL